MELLHIAQILEAEKPPSRRNGRQISQNGVSFRSLCGHCNNTVLGTKYDPELIRFSNFVTEFVRTSLSIPPVIEINGRPGLIARAVLGYMLAIGVQRHETGEMGEAVAAYVLGDDSLFPEYLDLYYWVYPYRRQVLMRGAGMTVKFGFPAVAFDLIKFFPLGFMAVWKKPESMSFNLPNLKSVHLGNGASMISIPVTLQPIPSFEFPEAPTPDGFTMYHDQYSLVGKPHKQRRNQRTSK